MRFVLLFFALWFIFGCTCSRYEACVRLDTVNPQDIPANMKACE